MNLNQDTRLQLHPNLKVHILAHHRIVICTYGQALAFSVDVLAILNAFTRPTTLSAAISQLQTKAEDKSEWVGFISAITKLYQAGILLEETEEKLNPANSPSRPYFQCSLHEKALTPISTGSHQGPVATNSVDMELNRNIHLQLGSALPDILGELSSCNRFLPGHPLLWVQEPGTRMLTPFWLDKDEADLIQQLIAQDISPSELETSVSETLAQANILVPRDYTESRTNEWQEAYTSSFDYLRANQYVTLRGLIHPLQIAALRRYYRALEHKGFLLPDILNPSSLRYALHNEAVARFIHQQICYPVQQVVREEIKPSYSFLAMYKSGASLPKHIDRPQCVWNLSLLIDADPETSLSESWPIFFEVDGEVKEVRLGMGDGVLYRGTDIPHWRNELPDGHMATLIFYHFVPQDFEGSLD